MVGMNYTKDVIDHKPNDKIALLSVSADASSAITVTFGELKRNSWRVANSVIALGIKQKERLLLLLPRVPSWYDWVLGCIRIGVITLPTSTLCTEKDIQFRVSRSEASVIVTLKELVPFIDRALATDPSLKNLVTHKIFVENPDNPIVSNSNVPSDWIEYNKLENNTDIRDQVYLERVGYPLPSISDTMMIYFTSGSTGNPKMVRHNFGYAYSFKECATRIMDLREDDVQWSLSDTGWAKTSYGKLFGQWMIGTTVLQYRQIGKFEPEIALQVISKYKVSVFCVPPTVFRMLIQLNTSKYDLSSLRLCCSGGEPLNSVVFEKWKELTGLNIYEFYGQTETPCIIGNSPFDPTRPGSMGKPIPGMQVDLVDDDGIPVKDNEEGHIVVKCVPTKPNGIFIDYWKDADLNESVFRNGYYYTQDKAYRDTDGYHWFIGRSDDVFKSSGYRIGPFEVETALLSSGYCAEAAVIGVPDDIRGSIIKAFIIPKQGVEPSEELKVKLQEHVKTTTAPYKYPREIEFVIDLPKTLSNKIKRGELKIMELQKRKLAGKL